MIWKVSEYNVDWQWLSINSLISWYYSLTVLTVLLTISVWMKQPAQGKCKHINLLLLVFVLFEWLLWATLECLSHQCLCCNLPPIEGIHLLLQLSSFLLQILLFFLVHTLELLKPLMKLRVMIMYIQSNVIQAKYEIWSHRSSFMTLLILTSFSFSFSSASVSFTLLTNICLISSSLRCSSTRNSFLLASYVCCRLEIRVKSIICSLYCPITSHFVEP